MPDPTPKPPARRARGRRSLSVSTDAAPLPEPPVTWLAETRADYAAFASSPVARHIVSSDLANLRRMFALADRSERFWRTGMRKPLVTGSQGQLVEHPLIKAALALDVRISAWALAYGWQPKARLALTVGLGDAARSAADLANDEVLAGDLEPLDLTILDGGAG